MKAVIDKVLLEFQSTPPRGWRPGHQTAGLLLGYFNPLHREGGDESSHHQYGKTHDFNPLHREGGDYCGQCNKCGYYSQFQSTPPRGWRPGPTKSTRQPGYYFGWSPDCSPTIGCSPLFQSTPPRGWRPAEAAAEAAIFTISIHSTARVETLQRIISSLVSWNFNPLHREGGDDPARDVQQELLAFQSTPPRGWRRLCNNLHPAPAAISIHSTARVETTNFNICCIVIRFQSTPPRGWRHLWTFSGSYFYA